MTGSAVTKPANKITNRYWWIVVIVAIVAITIIATVCIVRGMKFGTYVVAGKAWYGTKINVGCQ